MGHGALLRRYRSQFPNKVGELAAAVQRVPSWFRQDKQRGLELGRYVPPWRQRREGPTVVGNGSRGGHHAQLQVPIFHVKINPVANECCTRKRGWEVDRIFGDLEDTDDEEVKINQRNTGDSDDLSAAKAETKENLNDEGT